MAKCNTLHLESLVDCFERTFAKLRLGIETACAKSAPYELALMVRLGDVKMDRASSAG